MPRVGSREPEVEEADIVDSGIQRFHRSSEFVSLIVFPVKTIMLLTEKSSDPPVRASYGVLYV